MFETILTTVLLVLFIAVTAPIWMPLGGLLLWGGFKASDARKNAKYRRKADEERERVETLKRRNSQQRQQQIEELKAAVPKTPPRRMRATIRVNDIVNLALLPKNDGSHDLHSAELRRYAVDMILELPEKDRVLIRDERMDRVIIEKLPKYTDDDILNIFGQREQTELSLGRSTRIEDHVALKVIRDDPQQRTVASYRGETRDVLLADYLAVPYSCIFATKPEANDYADRLREKVLPQIRAMLDKTGARGPSETIEF